MTYRELLSQGESLLKVNNIGEYKLDAFYLLEYVFKMDKTCFLLKGTENINDEAKNKGIY